MNNELKIQHACHFDDAYCNDRAMKLAKRYGLVSLPVIAGTEKIICIHRNGGEQILTGFPSDSSWIIIGPRVTVVSGNESCRAPCIIKFK